MDKKSVFNTLRFITLTIICMVLIFSAVVITVLNMYKPATKTYLNGKFIGYFSNEQHFDDVYNELVAEKQSIDPNVKVYLECEPIFESCYIRDGLFTEQNVYTNLRAQVKTEFTIYNVAVNGEVKMTFTTQDDANKYVETLKKQVSKLVSEVKIDKVDSLGDTTTTDRAEAIMKDIVDRNKPVEIPKTKPIVKYKTPITTYNGKISANNANTQGGIWPTVSRYISSPYGWRRGSFHSGTDIAGSAGSPIYAYKDGVVTFSGWSSIGYGNLVKIDHGNGFATWYAHCRTINVRAGDSVEQGQTIAAMGSTGNSTGNHLHFEVRINGVHKNSYMYISAYK
ncbi:MAG: peptidoglycan DD-metalloendopeptidase family protein [Clostridia bacterium]